MDNKPNKTPWYLRGQVGQATVEYVLIAILVGGALIVALLATGPVLGNVFQSIIVATIGDDGITRDQPEDGATSFWLTVTWVATQTPQEMAFPTNVANPQPSEVPDGYVEPEPVEPEPELTQTPSPTVEPSPTPKDLSWGLEFNDLAEQPDWYRLASDVYLGQESWEGLFWEDRTTENTYEPFANPAKVRVVRGYDANESNFLNPLTTFQGMQSQHFSARFTRYISVEGPDSKRVGFRVTNPAGGYRIYYQTETGLCSNYKPPIDTRNTTSPPIECLVIDQWVNAPADASSVFALFPPGRHKVVVEHYQQAGTPNFQFELFSPQTNPDDVGLGSSNVDCQWNQYEGARSNTRDFSWSYAVGVDDMPNNSRCYLELRGYVDMDDSEDPNFTLDTTRTPIMSFWHIWDLNADANVTLQVARYPDLAEDEALDRDALAWSPIWQPTLTGTSNYEWTHETVPLTGFGPGENVTYRFVIESSGGSTGRKLWYVDDIKISNENLPDLAVPNPAPADTFTVCDDRATCANGFWNLDTDDQANDFRTTGRWALTENSGAVSGNAWEDDPSNPYSLEDGGERVYYIEFDKRIDVSSASDDGVTYNETPVDPDGDAGPPMITFYQTYNLKDNARLEMQYYDDATGEWTLLRRIVQTGNSTTAGASRPDKHYFEVPLHQRENATTGNLEGAADGWTAWYEGPIRLRFAMIVEPNARTAPDAPGWTLDNILIERLGQVDFEPYPVYDSAGDNYTGSSDDPITASRNRWTRTGLWEIGTGRAHGYGQFAFSDSPVGNYAAGSDTRMQLRAPIDLYSDTPSNPSSQACDASLPIVASCLPVGEQQAPAVNPTLTFWWNRDLANTHSFTVEIIPDGGVGTPITVWEYNYDANTARQSSWERAEIALYPFIPADATNSSAIEDDIVVSFRLNALSDTSTSADGIWLDEIRIEDLETPPIFLLGSGTNGGNGPLYYDDIDDRQLLPGETYSDSNASRWWQRFYFGGNWTAVNTTPSFPAQTGILALHDSIPLSVDPFDPANSFRYQENTFNTLEMIRHVDLTNVATLSGAGDPIGFKSAGTDASPVLTWWHRIDKGDRTRLRVQVAASVESPGTPGGPLTYGDDELYGWTNWKNVYVTPPSVYNDEVRDYQWVRERINLEYAPIYNNDGSPSGTFEDFTGKVIRVRWVLDANNTVSASDTRDGWFIDNIQFSTFKPRVFTLPFSDNGESMSNWLPEGTWGLDVEHYRGGSDIPSLGGDSGWTVHYLNCNRRPNPNSGAAATSNNNNGCAGALYETLLTQQNYRNLYFAEGDPADVNNVNADGQWYADDFVTGLSFEFDFDNDYGGRPPNTSNNYGWNDRFTAEFRRTVRVTEPFRYLFYARSDDGVRVGVTPFPTNSEIQAFPFTEFDFNTQVGTKSYIDPVDNAIINYNNVIDAWKNQAPTVYQGSVTLVPNLDNTPREYEITVHYYEQGGGAFLSMGLSGANASFSDSPMMVPSTDKADRVPVNYYSNTSLYLNGLLDLRSSLRPILQFSTIHELSNVNSTFYVEVSDDGGFTWNNNGLTNDFNLDDGTKIDAYYRSSWNDNNENWVDRLFNLSDYAGKMLALRFRLDVDASQGQVASTSENTSRKWNGVNLASLLVFDVQPSGPAPAIISQSELNVVVEQGGEAQLGLIASGQSPLRYEWFRGNTLPTDPNVVPSDAVIVATVANYAPPTDTTGTYKYWVRVSNLASDSRSDVNPAISSPYTVRVLSCLPQNIGECGRYRINLNGNDIATNDGSVPGWSGTNGSANSSTYKPNGGSGYSSTTRTAIDIPENHDSYFVQQAINDSMDADDLYETYMRSGSPMTWNLPVSNGSYIVKLYMADDASSSNLSNLQSGQFALTLEGANAILDGGPNMADVVLDGGAGTALMELIEASASAANASYTGPNNRVGGVLEMLPVSVVDGNLTITITPTSSKNVNISGLEVVPISLDNIEIAEQPADRNIARGFGTTLTVRATGRIDYIAWYRGTPGDTSGAPIKETDYSDNATTREETLTLTNVTSNGTYWARIETRTSGTAEQLNSNGAEVTVCDFDPAVLGSCNRWYVNSGQKFGTFTSSDGTIWHPDEAYRDDFDDTDRKSDGETDWVADNFDKIHTHNGAGETIFQTYIDDDNFGYQFPVENGTYTVKFFFHDPDQQADRRFDIRLEGFEYVDSYNIYAASGNQHQRYREESFTVTVLDGTLNVWLDNDNSSSLLSGFEFYPQSAD